MTQMLQFNPFLRPTVEQCLQSPYFEKVRNFAKKEDAKIQVNLEIEHKNLTIDELRYEFNKIVNDYQ